jgi:hypothetical protein
LSFRLHASICIRRRTGSELQRKCGPGPRPGPGRNIYTGPGPDPRPNICRDSRPRPDPDPQVPTEQRPFPERNEFRYRRDPTSSIHSQPKTQDTM